MPVRTDTPTGSTLNLGAFPECDWLLSFKNRYGKSASAAQEPEYAASWSVSAHNCPTQGYD